jgi:hypothetical protein
MRNAAFASVLVLACAAGAARATVITYVADAEINRPVTYVNMSDSQGIAYVPGERFDPPEAKDRLLLVNVNNYDYQRYLSYWQIDQVEPGTLVVSEAMTILASDGTPKFSSHGGVTFVDDPVNPHLLLATRYWGFASEIATIDIDLDITSYQKLYTSRGGGGDDSSAIAWDPTRDSGSDRGFIYDGNQGGNKLTLYKQYSGGYPPTGTTNTTGYADPPEIAGVVSGRTWSATTNSFFSAVGTIVYETDSTGTLLGSTDLANLLPGPLGDTKTVTGLANDDERGYLWVFSRDTTANKGYIVAFAVPEPMTVSLLALGGLALLRRRRR